MGRTIKSYEGKTIKNAKARRTGIRTGNKPTTVLKSELVSDHFLPGCSSRCILKDISAGLFSTSPRDNTLRQLHVTSRVQMLLTLSMFARQRFWICPWFWSVAHMGECGTHKKKTPPGALQLVPPSQRVHKPCSVTYRPIVLMCPPAPTVVMLEGFPYMSLPAESKFTWNYISHCHLQYTTITFFLFIVVSHRKVRQINFKTKSLLRNPAVAAVGSHTGSHSAQLHSYNERGESTLRSRLSQTWLRFRKRLFARQRSELLHRNRRDSTVMKPVLQKKTKNNMKGTNNDEINHNPNSCFQLLTGLFKWLIPCLPRGAEPEWCQSNF